MDSTIATFIQEQFLGFITSLPRFVLAILVMVVSMLIAKYAHRYSRRWLKYKLTDMLVVNLISQVIRWTIIIFGLAWSLDTLGFGGIASSIVAGAGISALVIGFALKDIGENLLAGIALAFKPPFRIKDLIEAGGVSGEVRSIDLRTTHLRSLEGEDIYVPNSNMLKGPITNFTRQGAIKGQITYAIKDIKAKDKAAEIVMATLGKISQVTNKPAARIDVVDVETGKLTLKLNYWLADLGQAPAELNQAKSEVIWQTKSALAEANLI